MEVEQTNAASVNAPNLANQSIGAYLKAVREAQGRSLEEVAREIDRKADDLARIEADDFKSLVAQSAAVYVQGAIRNFASQLQVPRKDIDLILKRFHADLAKEQKEQPIKITEANVASQSHSFKRGHFVPLMRLVLPLLVFVLAASQVLNTDSWMLRKVRETFPSGAQSSELNVSQGQPINLNGSTTSTPVLTSGESTVLNVNSTTTQSALDSASAPLAPNTTTTLNLESTPAGEQSALSPAPALTLESTSDTPATALVNPEANATSDATPATTDSATLSDKPVKIEVVNDVWFEVLNAQKKKVHTGTFKKGTIFELAAEGAPYQLSIGKPSALKVEINGQAVELKSVLMRGTKNQYALKVE